MSEYFDNKYSRMYSYFDDMYENDTERKNYVDVLNSMKKEKKVSNLVNSYSNVLYKILLSYYRKEENFPSYWVEFMTVDQQWLWENLKAFLNEQIKRIFDENTYSDKIALECITNLRDGINEDGIRNYIVSKSSEEVNATLKDIIKCLQTIRNAPKYMSEFNIETNGYREYKPKYIEDIKFLIKNGYQKTYKDSYYEQRAKINYFPDTNSMIIFAIIVILIFGVFAMFLSKINPLTIIILIGLPGALLSFLRK